MIDYIFLKSLTDSIDVEACCGLLWSVAACLVCLVSYGMLLLVEVLCIAFELLSFCVLR